MAIKIHAIGHITDSWINTALQVYLQRLPKHFQPQIYDFPTPKRTKSSTVESCKQQEHLLLTRNTATGSYLIALDEQARTYTSEQFATALSHWQMQHQHVCFLLGGPDGHCADTLEYCDQSMSLSALTFTHQFAKLILVEQIYRAFTILHHHPYHR